MGDQKGKPFGPLMPITRKGNPKANIQGTPFDKTIAERGPIGHNGGPICINREKGTKWATKKANHLAHLMPIARKGNPKANIQGFA